MVHVSDPFRRAITWVYVPDEWCARFLCSVVVWKGAWEIAWWVCCMCSKLPFIEPPGWMYPDEYYTLSMTFRRFSDTPPLPSH